MSENVKTLRYFDLVMIVIGLVIGMGIFRTAATSASHALTPAIYFSAWIAGGVIALMGSFVYAEIGSRFPVTGGFYKVFALAWHPSISFAVNAVILISNASGMIGVALIGSGYFCKAIYGEPVTQQVQTLFAGMSVIGIYFVNLLGLRFSSTTLNILMVVKIGMLLMLIAALFIPAAYAPNVFQEPVDITVTEWLKSFGASMVAVTFTYGGYQHLINFGGDVNNPKKTMPGGILTATAIIICLYLTVNYAYYSIVGFVAMKGEGEIASVVAAKILGVNGGRIFSTLMFLAVLAYVNVEMMNTPRIMYAMSEDKLLPAALMRKNTRNNSLYVSLTVFTIISLIVLYFAETFETILSFAIFLDCFGFIASAWAIFKLRKTTAHLNDTGIFIMRGYPLIPILFILSFILLTIVIAFNEPKTAMTGFFVLMGLVGFYFTKKVTSGK